MDLHDHYLRFPTLDISILRAVNDKLEDDISFVPHHLLQFYNCEITKEKLNISKLEVYRMLLCYEYQQTFSKVERHDNKRCIVSDVKICFPSVEAIFPVQHLRSVAEMSILRDIIILQTVLFCNTVSIKQHLQNFLNSCNIYIMHNDTRTMYMKVLEYLLESLCLHRFSHSGATNNKEELEEIGPMYLEVIKLWMNMKEDSEWGVFASMFPMLVNTFVPERILFPLWEYILSKTDDLKEFLIVLSIVMDTCLTSSYSTKSTCIHRDIFCKNTFWLQLLKGLRSPLQQYRKQALYIMRRATDFMSQANNLHVESTKAEITPFICSKSDNSALPVDNIRQKFFLMYESLEEKQYHLVAPALTHITSLVKANKEHESCQCFNIVWLRCILEKALQHENNNIAKWSVSYVCKLDSSVLFDDRFLELFVNILNNSFLYECQMPDEDYPEIVTELSTFFRCIMKRDLFNRFFKKVSEVIWGPIAIFYIIHTMRIASQEAAQRNDWQAAELNAIKSLVEKNLNMYSKVLRNASQTELLRTIPNFVRKINDLTLLANVLATFSHVRGCFPWYVITAWLREVLAKEDAVTFVEQTCASYSNENRVPAVSPKTFASMIFLLCDADLVFSCGTCPAVNALNNWLSCLNSIEMRPYADIHSIVDVAEFISHLIEIYQSSQGETNHPVCVIHLMKLYTHATFKFLIKNLRKMATGLTFEDYTRYASIMSSHTRNAKFFMPYEDAKNYAEQLQEESICLLKDTQQRQSMQYLYGIHVLYDIHLCYDIFTSHSVTEFYMEDLLDAQAIPVQTSNRCDADMINLKGKIASKYYLILSKMTSRYFLHTWDPKQDYVHDIRKCIPVAKLLTNLLKFVELGGMETVSEVAHILYMLVTAQIIRDTNDWETFKYIFQSCWRCTFVSKKNIVFWKTVRDLTRVIINNIFLESQLDNMEFIREFVDQLMKESENTSTFKMILLSQINIMYVCNVIQFEKVLLNCLLHGPILRRDEKLENYVQLYIAKHLGQYYRKDILSVDYNKDVEIRALATILLQRIVDSKLDYVTTVLSFIFETLEKYKNKRYFNDSYTHKLKHRLMQMLLILEPFMNKEHMALLQKKLQDSILSESNQHSVRLMQEWLMIRILVRNSDLHDKLWKFFAESIEKRPGCTVSVAGIVYHVAQLLLGDMKKIFIETALPYIAQCCLGQQFNMRLYNQFILVQLCNLMKRKNIVTCSYNGIYQAAMANLQQASLTKNSVKIQDNFYFSCFHPINDYSLQTIYFELPRLTNVSSDEWISPDVFEKFEFEECEHFSHRPLKLYNVSSLLSDTTTSIYLSKSSADDAESLVNNVETYLEGLQNIQRKMDPSKFTAPLYNNNFRAIEESMYQDLHEGLIVVASFVNRPPNLGGITRTCEIFGVKSLIIANLDCVKDKEFQCLSVSAERWINMQQVKPHELQQYLLEKKNAGWSLIGVEQTAKSVNLLEAKFEKKTILVLGNEKDGIPANFLPLFNTCVEIPQMGVIRSLNVHVTAAICIWQYASQHTLK